MSFFSQRDPAVNNFLQATARLNEFLTGKKPYLLSKVTRREVIFGFTLRPVSGRLSDDLGVDLTLGLYR